MGLAWQQGPLAPGSAGRFLVPDPLPARMLYVEPLRRRMGVSSRVVDRTRATTSFSFTNPALSGRVFPPEASTPARWSHR